MLLQLLTKEDVKKCLNLCPSMVDGNKTQPLENVKKNLELISKKMNIKKENLVLMHQTHSNKVIVINKEKNITDIQKEKVNFEKNYKKIF